VNPPDSYYDDTVQAAAGVAPFSLAPQGFTQAARATESALQTAEELFSDLLRKDYVPKAPETELSRLLQRGPQTDFERLLQKEFVPKGGTTFTAQAGAETAAETTTLLGRLLSGAASAVGLLLYSQDLGPDAATEAALVAKTLTAGGGANVPVQPTTNFGSDLEGLPKPTLGIPLFEPGSLPEITVEAPGIPAPLPAPQLQPIPYIDLGYSPLPTAASLAEPVPNPKGRPARQPQPNPEPAPELGTLTSPLEEPSSSASPKPQPQKSAASQALPSPQGFDQCEQPQNKKKRKKKKPREICHEGTYRETKSSLHKSPRRKIECR
jgi:hypothetical protein